MFSKPCGLRGVARASVPQVIIGLAMCAMAWRLALACFRWEVPVIWFCALGLLYSVYFLGHVALKTAQRSWGDGWRFHVRQIREGQCVISRRRS
jgi:hypothetical protein